MMIEGNAAASQPAPTAQTSDEGKGKNISIGSLAAMLQRGKPEPEARQEAPAQDTEEATNPTEAHEPQQSPVEAEAGEQAPETQDGEQAAEAEADVSSEEVLSQDEEDRLDPRTQERINKRIGKEVAKRKELEAKLKEAEAKAEQALQQAQELAQQQPAPVIAPTPENPLANIADVNGLVKEQQQAKEIKRWAEDALDAVESGQQVVVDGKDYSKAEIRAILRNTERTLNEHIPARYQFLQQRQTFTKQAEAHFPFLKDKTSEGYQLVQTAKRSYGAFLASVPDGDYIAALAAKGLMALQAEQAAQKPAAAPRTAPKPPASQAATPAATAKPRLTTDAVRARQVDAEIEQIKSSKRNLSTDDVTAMLLKKASIKSR